MAVSKKVYNLAKACWDKWGDEAGGLPDEKADYVFGMGKKQGWLNLSKPDELVDILNALEDFAEGNEVTMTSTNTDSDDTIVATVLDGVNDNTDDDVEIVDRENVSWADLVLIVTGVLDEKIVAGDPFTAYDVTVTTRQDNPDKEIEHSQVRRIVRSRMALETSWDCFSSMVLPGNPTQYCLIDDYR